MSSSCQIQSPVSYGWIRPKIIIPQDLDISLSQEELRFIFLHELQHCRHR
ncbi:MAG: M56 family metallopeptidase, partial [Blautia sp.]